MTIMDAKLEMADAQSLATNTAGTYQVGDVIDTGVANSNLGAGTSIFWKAQIGTVVTGTTTCTLSLTLQHSSTGTGSWTTLIAGTSVATPANFSAGSVVEHVVLPITGNKRYIRTVFTNTSTVSQGTLDSLLELEGGNV